MTPERQKWWDSLPQREKMLREQIREIKVEISHLKFARDICCTDEDTKWVISQMKEQKVTLTALKHELDRTTVATYVGHIEEGVSSYQCKKCGGMFENFEQPYCCWCGRKIVEGK